MHQKEVNMNKERTWDTFYVTLGKNNTEYVFSSMKYSNKVRNIVDIAESLGLNHKQRFVDGIDIPLSRHFYLTLNLRKDCLMLVGRYHEDTIIQSSIVRELVLNGYDLGFDGHMILISLNEKKDIRETIMSLKALSEKFPNGFN